MRWHLLVVPVLLVVGCASPSAPEAGSAGTVRVLIAGTVDLTGGVAAVAEADPEGIFREVRFPARRADLAIVSAMRGEPWALLAAAGFDAAVCGAEGASAPGAATRSSVRTVGGPEVVLICGVATTPGPGEPDDPHPEALTLAVADDPLRAARGEADILVVEPGGSPAVEVITPPVGRPSLVISGLGSLLAAAPGTTERKGALLEVLADGDGVIAYRLGRTDHADLRAHFAGWDLPQGAAVLLDGEWWSLVRPVLPAPVRRPPPDPAFTYGDLIVAAVGDVTGDGTSVFAASYRHPFRPGALSEARPGAIGIDSLGRTAHLGVFTLEGEARWAAGFIPHPVGDLTACDGSVALAYTGLDDPGVVATGAAIWTGLALRPAPLLPGGGTPGCADVDGDGRLDPVILGRSS